MNIRSHPIRVPTGPIVNSEQAAAWNGYEGSHWAELNDRYDALNGRFNEQLLTAGDVGELSEILEIGCGTGQLAREAARRAIRGSVLGVDLSDPMLQRAAELTELEGLTNVRFELGDAQVHPFRQGQFDIVLSRFGVMFFADPVAAFSNIGRALRAEGRLAMLSPQALDRSDLGAVLAALAPYLPEQEPADGDNDTGPMSLSDAAHIKRVLSAAGFFDVQVRAAVAKQHWGISPEDAGSFLAAWGPVRHALRCLDPEARAQAHDALVEAMRAFVGPDGVTLTYSAWMTTARRLGRNGRNPTGAAAQADTAQR